MKKGLSKKKLSWIDPLDLEDEYKFITYEEPSYISGVHCGFGTDTNFEYTYFIKLMNMLEAIYKRDGRGFWCNRHLIIREMPNLTIVVDRATMEILAFYVIRRRKNDDKFVIDFLQVFQPGKGIGKRLMQCNAHFHLCVEEALADSVGFWKKLGIPCERVLE